MCFSCKYLFCLTLVFYLPFTSCTDSVYNKTDREKVVRRHNIETTLSNPKSPAQVGNGEFAFGADITGLQTFVPFNTMAHWAWHSFPLPEGTKPDDFKGAAYNNHGRNIMYPVPDPEQPELSEWLAGNPHAFNLGRIGFVLSKSDGSMAAVDDLTNTKQVTDLWNGIIISTFELEGKSTEVITSCHPELDALGVSVKSDLISTGQLKVFFDFPYADGKNMEMYLGDYGKQDAHSSLIEERTGSSVSVKRKMDDAEYHVSINWQNSAEFLSGDTISSEHRFYLVPSGGRELKFSAVFSSDKAGSGLSADEIVSQSKQAWPLFWKSGASIDLSGSSDPRWMELERRIVLSQYLMKVNEAGSLPPQESGLVNNGWFGRFHFEMISWHYVHYALWNRWDQIEKSLQVYGNYLETSKQRAEKQGYKGARWPKCTGDTDREWPHIIHAMLIWQQPHPIYFAELDYRLHPSAVTIEKWKDIVFETADFMADYAFLDSTGNRYVLGPPVYIVSENTDPLTTINPAFELGYWRYGLRTAQEWRERAGLARDKKWDDVLARLSDLPIQDGLYVTHEGIDSMWTKFNFEHPALTGVFGMLPGDGVDTACFGNTLEKVSSTWIFNRTWGWDFPMMAMAAARSGNTELAIEMLLHKSPGFQFDEHGLATGGPFPYFPSNGALLSTVAMMAGGWDGSEGHAPGFPPDGKWKVNAEGFKRMP